MPGRSAGVCSVADFERREVHIADSLNSAQAIDNLHLTQVLVYDSGNLALSQDNSSPEELRRRDVFPLVPAGNSITVIHPDGGLFE